MLEPQYLIIALLFILVFLISKHDKASPKKVIEGKPNLILRHYPSHISHLNYYPFYNPWGFRRHHRFHGSQYRYH